MKIAIVGVTGMVGTEMIKVLENSNIEITEFIPVASERSIGKEVLFNGLPYKVIGMQDAINKKADIAIFSAGGSTSKQWAPEFAKAGTTVIDNSSAWRMDTDKKLIVPEINAHLLTKEDKIIANPNCSTIQMVVALAPLHKKYGIKRLVISTYQSVTGTGVKAVQQLEDERAGKKADKTYPHPIDLNCLPHGGDFLANGYTSEEEKLVNETQKILNDERMQITATVVRVPVIGGHSESVNIEFSTPYELEEVRHILNHAEGIIVQDDPQNNLYPMPLSAHHKDEVFVGRIRRDFSTENALNMWIVADNLRKGAATNAVQIAEYLVKHQLTGNAS